MDDRDGDGTALSRRSFLALSAAGLVVVALPGSATVAAERASTFSHRGVKVSVATTAAGPRLSVDGEDLVVISSNGAYRAVAFAFSPQPTLASLGRRVAENLDRIPGRF